MRLRNALTATTTVCAIAGLCACTPAPPPPPLVPAAGVGSIGGAEPYRIQAGDVLGVRLLLNPDLNEDVVVRPDGHMSTTVVKDERAAGRTVVELADALSHDYTSIIRNPRLTVELKTFSPARIYVGGEVNKPGESVTAGLAPTLSQAIVRAGGLKAGDTDRVFIIRRGPNDVPQLFSARLRDVMRDQDSEADVRLAQYRRRVCAAGGYHRSLQVPERQFRAGGSVDVGLLLCRQRRSRDGDRCRTSGGAKTALAQAERRLSFVGERRHAFALIVGAEQRHEQRALVADALNQGGLECAVHRLLGEGNRHW